MIFLQEPRITSNVFFHPSNPNKPPVTIFFISGNPGLISYYHTFLSLLASNLGKSTRDDHHRQQVSCQIYGCSLAGFHIDDHESRTAADSDSSSRLLYDLEQQICHVQHRLEEFMENCNAAAPREKTSKVILMGHSVGAYIAMEVLRRHREDEGPASNSAKKKKNMPEFDIIGGVMLFPTVVDIAKSPSGRKLTWLLFFIPQLALVVSFLAKLLVSIFPDATLRSIIKCVMGSPPDEAVDTTVAFLKSKGGVRQALHMAADEMRTITSDKWSDDVWGASTAQEPLSRLVFYFGRNDHWVAEQTRDEVVELRGRTEGGPKMIVCEEGLPHAFCLRHNEVMARKVTEMVKDIVSGQ